MKNKIQIFESQKVRALWDEEAEKWWFSIVDIVGVLTDQQDQNGARNYWKVLKNRLVAEGNQLVTNCNQLKMLAEDGKMRLTDVADTEQILRLIQSIPSKKAEPFKLWLAKAGKGFNESTKVAKEGATTAKVARKQLEKSLRKPAISSMNVKKVLGVGKG